MEIRIEEITCENALNKLKRKIPYGWDLNVYRGCQHGCPYCFAQYSHKYLDKDNFTGDILVKTNIVEKLEQELRSPRWKREVINLGGVTDSYQPAEAEYKIMPEILKLLIKYKTPAIISTKSDLVLRDYDLIDQLSRITYINIAATITCMDENIRSKIEPGGVTSLRRFAMLKEFRKTNASTGLHLMPIIPFLTDNRENLETLFYYANDSKVHYALPGTLYLRGKTRSVFLDFMQKDFPHLFESFSRLYKTGSAGPEYKTTLYEMVNELRRKYNVQSGYAKVMKEKMNPPNPQLSLF
ncbi:radical SAM protein [Bacteroides sp. 519]|uniref:SPL family radical SAM protein n=1 Tax=Bacteroides sp. 519 TaxID=2302937 RepID=UPI00194021EC|nr:radical SAM protein [Bacteroides sp. 519]